MRAILLSRVTCLLGLVSGLSLGACQSVEYWEDSEEGDTAPSAAGAGDSLGDPSDDLRGDSEGGVPDRDSETAPEPQNDPDSDTDPDSDDGSFTPCRAWSLGGDEGEWTLLHGMSVSGSQEAGSTTFSNSSDPYMSVPTSEDMDRCTLVEVIMQVSGAESYWELFWRGSSDADFSAERSMRFELFADGSWVRYVFDLSVHSAWSGPLAELRLDPHEGKGTVRLRQLRLLDPDGSYPPPLDLGQVTWLHTDVSAWAETATLSSVSIDSSQICMDHDKSSTWSAVTIEEDVDVNANPWVFIWRPDLEGDHGRWYGATWEWMRPGTLCKNSYALAGDHIKQSPYHSTSGWAPSRGETLHFMVSGLARSSERNAEERSNTYQVRWP